METHIDMDAPNHTMPILSDLDMDPDLGNSMVNSETNLIISPARPMSTSPRLGMIEGFVRSANIFLDRKSGAHDGIYHVQPSISKRKLGEYASLGAHQIPQGNSKFNSYLFESTVRFHTRNYAHGKLSPNSIYPIRPEML